MANKAFVYAIAGDHDGDGFITKNEMAYAWAYGLTECNNALIILRGMASWGCLNVDGINFPAFMHCLHKMSIAPVK
jgi:hypothetical protein